MSESQNDTGTLQVLLERLNKLLLPRVLAVKMRVDAGEKLTNADIEFLRLVLADARQVEPLVVTHPQYSSLAGRVVSLYDEITRKALENEQGA
jgi:hypothetical protein